MEGLEAGAVFHRGLACDDDAAGDVELLAHVLWYHPASDSAAQKHERLSLIEGLIAVGSAFGGGVEAVTMHKSKYVFVQVEAEVWMVWVFDATLDLHEHALASQMLQAYDGFALLHGGVSCVLDAGDGLEKFRTLAELRRKLRKASDKASRDYEGEAYVAEHAAIAAALSLEESNFDDPAKDCREELVRHFGRVWKRTDLSSADLGTDLCGIEQPHDSAAFLQLHRAQRAVKVHGVRGVSISYKGGLLWNGLDSSEFAQIHRYATARDREARAATPRRRHGFSAPNLGTVRLVDGLEAVRCLDEDATAVPGGVWCPDVHFLRSGAHRGAWADATRRQTATARGPECAIFYSVADFFCFVVFDSSIARDAPQFASLCAGVQAALDAGLKPLAETGFFFAMAPVVPETQLLFHDATTYAVSGGAAFDSKPFDSNSSKAFEDMHDTLDSEESSIVVQLEDGWLVAKSGAMRRRLFVRLGSAYHSLPELDDAMKDVFDNPLRNVLL